MRCPAEEFKLNLSNMSSFFGELLSTCFIRSAPGVWVPPVDGDLLEICDPGRRRPLSHGGLGEAGAVLGAEKVRKPNKIGQSFSSEKIYTGHNREAYRGFLVQLVLFFKN